MKNIGVDPSTNRLITDVSPSNWKPSAIEDFIGTAAMVAGVMAIKIRKLLSRNEALRLLLYGAPGTGKTALAAWIASQLAGHPSNIERKSGKEIGVDEVRAWMQSLGMGSLFGYQVRLINELDKCSDDAQVLMLEYADELRDGCAIIATSNLDIQRMQARFQTRWIQYEVKPPTQEEIAGLLIERFGVPPADAQSIAFGAGGNVRAALLDTEGWQDVQAFRLQQAA